MENSGKNLELSQTLCGKKRLSFENKGHDTSECPYVWFLGIIVSAKENLRRSVGSRARVRGECSIWRTKLFSKSEISYFNIPLSTAEYIVRLKILR